MNNVFFKDFLLIIFYVIAAPPLGPRSVHLTCPACNAFIKTSITKNATGCAYIWCITLMCCM